MNTSEDLDIEASKRFGRQAISEMYRVAADSPVGAVVESTFHRTLARSDIASLPGPVVEIFCQCRREICIARYRSRSDSRHRGHLDSSRTDDDLWNVETATPVDGGWPVVVVDTEFVVDVSALVNSISLLGLRHL